MFIQKRFNIQPYLLEEHDGRWYVGIPPDDIIESQLRRWCDEVIGEYEVEWGVDYDEFYSPLTSGTLFWFTSEESLFLFRARCL